MLSPTREHTGTFVPLPGNGVRILAEDEKLRGYYVEENAETARYIGVQGQVKVKEADPSELPPRPRELAACEGNASIHVRRDDVRREEWGQVSL
jgi:hypothetical protein